MVGYVLSKTFMASNLESICAVCRKTKLNNQASHVINALSCHKLHVLWFYKATGKICINVIDESSHMHGVNQFPPLIPSDRMFYTYSRLEDSILGDLPIH